MKTSDARTGWLRGTGPALLAPGAPPIISDPFTGLQSGT